MKFVLLVCFFLVIIQSLFVDVDAKNSKLFSPLKNITITNNISKINETHENNSTNQQNQTNISTNTSQKQNVSKDDSQYWLKPNLIKVQKISFEVSNVHPGYYDDKRNEEVMAETRATASEDHQIILKNSTNSKFITPKIVQSFYYDDENTTISKKPISPLIVQRTRNIFNRNEKKEEYYNPAKGILGDAGICDNILDAIFCLHQGVCGWCPFTQTCRKKGENNEVLCDTSNYVFAANLIGFDPSLIAPETMLNMGD